MAATGNNFINFVNELVYGDLGTGELTTPPIAGAKNHIHWTRDNIPNSFSTTVTGTAFLTHHLDYMLARYEAWRSKYFLPPLRPWDGQTNIDVDQSATVPGAGALPATVEALGTSIRLYYNNDFRGGLAAELGDEVKAPQSYRYWAFIKWASDLRKRVLGQPVIHVHKVFDRDGTILSELDFTNIFHQVHHVWHTDKPIGTGWIVPTPFFNTSAGQHLGKKELSRTQIGAEFFTFHRDHLELFDRWLARSGQDNVQAINTCAHDTDPNDPVPSGVQADYSGYPHIEDWSSNPPNVILNDVHTTYWEGDLNEFDNLGEMGQLHALDFNQFDGDPVALGKNPIPIPGTSDAGYHGTGHVLNSDLAPAVENNFVPRFFAWHGHIDNAWKKREPRFNVFQLVQADNSNFPEPGCVTIVRDLTSNTDAVDPAMAITSIDINNGQGTVRVKINVENDPFNRDVELVLRCEILRETGGTSAEIELTRNLDIIDSGVPGANERLQNTDFTEEFIFDGTAGTVDGDGDGPFKSDNLGFVPTAVGFKNSRVKVSGYLTCKALPSGTIPVVNGTISSVGLAVTGTGTSFTSQLKQGDLIRANGQVRQVVSITNNTSLTLLDAFAPNLGGATAFERLDGFDHESVIEIPLIQEKVAPLITSYLDRSTFSIEQVDAAGTTVFNNAFYVVLQDRTSRPLNIVWPADVEPALYGIIAPPVFASGIHTDLAQAPIVELRDPITNALIPGVSIEATVVQPEDPGQDPTIPQRITYPCRITFTGQAAFAGLVNPGDLKDAKFVVTATDRSGNRIVDESLVVRLQTNPNPFMLDGDTSWLSMDTRVFQIQEGQARFGVGAGWTDPYAFIQQVIGNFRTGGGIAGGETFASLPEGQSSSTLEYATSIGGINIYNFALAQVHLQSNTGITDLRATFRFFRWGTANVEFNDTLAYRTAVSGIGLLGKTTTNELASIPFFAQTRGDVTDDMTLQEDTSNLFDFGPTGGGEDQSYFGVHLDINEPTVRFPQTYSGDGPFGGTLLSIRDLLEDHHQCMVVELVHSGDPTIPGTTPGTSDNLAQRNLLIVQTANPGTKITRTIQHSFNIDLTRSIKRPQFDAKMILDDIHLPHGHGNDDPPNESNDVHNHNDHHETKTPDQREKPDPVVLINSKQTIKVLQAQPALQAHGDHQGLEAELKHLEQGWMAQAPNMLAHKKAQLIEKFHTQNRWSFDYNEWKPTTGLDELVFFWNNLPKNAEVELYLPSANVEEVFNFRNLRHAPNTVKIIDSQTLRLYPTGTTFLPISPFHGDNLAGLIKIELPKGIKKGQRFMVDVLQMRADEARILGGFQLHIQVEKALELINADLRTLELFHKRLSVKDPNDRWYPIVARQVEFARARSKGMVDLANEENPGMDPIKWVDPTVNHKGKKLCVILEKIQITDDREPFFKGKGEFRFFTHVWTPDNGGIIVKKVLPEKRCFKLSDIKGSNEVVLNQEIFCGWVEYHLILRIGGLELDTFDPDDRLNSHTRKFTGNPKRWLGTYAPDGAEIDVQDMDGWLVWYRIEQVG